MQDWGSDAELGSKNGYGGLGWIMVSTTPIISHRAFDCNLYVPSGSMLLNIASLGHAAYMIISL